MSTIVTRSGKGSPLSHVEVDANFSNLNTDKIQSGNTVAALTITSASVVDLAVTGTTSFDGAQGTAGQVLTSGGTGVTPTWTTPSVGGSGTVTSVAATVPSVLSITGSPITTSGTLAIGYSGTALPIANGGTGATTAAEAFADLTPLTLTTASATPLVLTNTSGYQQQIIGSTNQTITLPSTATLAVGWSFLITNGTGFTVTVQTSTGASVYSNSNIGTYRVWCISTANNNAASWSAGAETFSFETGTGSVVRATSPTIASATLTSPTATGALAFTGTTSQTAQFATNQTTANTTITTSQTSGTLTIGGTSGTGTQTIGRSTVSQQTDIQAGATASGSTKTMNIGTGGLSGSTTNIAIGSTAGTSTNTLNGVTAFSAGTVSLPAITTTGDTNTGIFFSAADTIDFAEGGVATGQFDSSGNFKFNSGYGSVATAYGCRAWVNFNGTGTVAIRASGNVSSITDNGTGDYTVNFSNAMPDANYAVNVTPLDTVNHTFFSGLTSSAPTSSAVRFTAFDSALTAYRDVTYLNVSIFR